MELEPERCLVRPLEAPDAVGDRTESERERERERLPVRVRQDGEAQAEEAPLAHRKRYVMDCTCF